MQTFLPYPNFRQSAKCLDRQRLGKQRVENMQIMKCIVTGAGGWKNHPAVKMWKKHPRALLAYQSAIVEEWLSRGYKDTCYDKTLALFPQKVNITWSFPSWIGGKIHSTHRSNLLHKNFEYYKQFGWPETNQPKLDYYWPRGLT